MAEQVLFSMRRLVAEGSRADIQVVLVANSISGPHLLRAIRYGLVSFLPRDRTSMAGVLQAVLAGQQGRAQLPDECLKSLIDRLRNLQGLVVQDSAGLASREVDILRLLAEGMDTAEIARNMNYSESTVKSIATEMMSRLGLRNRTHAVAYAARAGVL
ncbi:LuxR C-terminal-related transcriptional regulator [Streptomyces sp. NPDC054765]